MFAENKVVLYVIAAGIWFLVLGDMFGSKTEAQVSSDAVAQGVKSALNECVIQRTGQFKCRQNINEYLQCCW